MDRKLVLALMLLAIVSALLLGKGITGMVAIGTSCCFGKSCPPDDLCPGAAPHLESPAQVSPASDIWLGFILLAFGGTFLLLHSRH